MFSPNFLANFIIALREGLEMVLVVGIIAAYLRKTDRQRALPKMWLGVSLAALLPLGLGAILTYGPKGLSFTAQETIGGVLSVVATAMITGMLFWMGKQARHQKRELEGKIEDALVNGSDWALVSIAVIAVGREGLETALMVWATVKSSVDNSVAATSVGLFSGFAVAIVLGYLIYRGALHLNLRLFFVFTGYFLILVAAGILSYGVHDLQEAGFLPGLNSYAWDLSEHYPAQGSFAHFAYIALNAMFQFHLQPSVLQVVAWLIYALPVTVLFARATKIPTPKTVSTRA
ncbi:iron uptake transporter permease EfeU [Dermabacteraceae bacterium P13088]